MYTGDKKYWEETQRVEESWFWILMFSVLVLSLAGMIVAMLSASTEWYIILAAGASITLVDGGVIFMIRNMQLRTAMTKTGVYYRLWPIESKTHLLTWAEVKEIHFRKPPQAGFGKKIRFRYGTVYTMTSGKERGMEFHLQNGKKLFISTRQPDGVRHALQKMEITIPVIVT